MRHDSSGAFQSTNRSQMSEVERVLDFFVTGVVSEIYNSVDVATKLSISVQDRRRVLEARYDSVRMQMESIRQNLELGPPQPQEQPQARLPSDHELRSENAQRCVTMCSRMTVCNSDPNKRLVCGGVVLRAGHTFENLQANWDLIDTVTGADA